MDPRDVLRALRAGWYFIVGGVLLGLVAAYYLNTTATPQYSSSTRLFVAAAAVDDTDAAVQGDLLSRQRILSYAELLTDESLAAQVVSDLRLPLTPADVAGKVSAVVVADTVFLDVTVTDSSAERARDIAASLTTQFTRQAAVLETPEGAPGPTVEVTVLRPPRVEPDPVSPDVVRNYTLTPTLGLLLGTGLALLRRGLDRTVRSADHVSAASGSGPLGMVPRNRRLRRAPVFTGHGRDAATAEAFRAIRTTLTSTEGRRPPRVVAVTGAMPGEGATTLAVNLAAALGRADGRVLLIEADLRSPRIAAYLDLEERPGLAEVLRGTVDFHAATQRWADGRVTVLTAGSPPDNPSELLGSKRMRTLLEAVRKSYDHVVVDTPALLAVTDAAVLGSLVDGYLVAARYGETHRADLAESATVLSRLRADVLGTVVLAVPRSRAGRGAQRLARATAKATRPRSGATPVIARARRTPRRPLDALVPTPTPARDGGVRS